MRPSALLKDRAPWYPIRDEDPVHITACHLSVRGMSHARIAKTFGKSEAWMSNLARQPFFEARCAAIVEAINIDLLQQQVHRRRRVRPLIVVALHDSSGSCDVPACVSFAVNVRGEPICEGPAGKVKKPRPRAASNTKPAPKPMPAPIPMIEPEPSWQAIGGDDEENYFAETAVTPPPKPVNPREAARRRLAEFAEIDRLENYRKYCP
jgi:hypothetical protein